MIGKDENQEEEVSYKVADRRKFNADGSLRDGITLEPEPEPAPAPAQAPVEAKAPEAPKSAPPPAEFADDDAGDFEGDDYVDEDKIPGAKDPASFVNFLSTIATNAAAALGAVPHPST